MLDRLRARITHKDVLFVYDSASPWTVYRCDNQAEALDYVGLSSDVVQIDQIDLAAAAARYDVVILNRIDDENRVAGLLEPARRADKSVLFAADDLLFAPAVPSHFAFLDEATESDRETWWRRLEAWRATLEACGAAIVSTEPLAEHARKHVPWVGVVYNAVSAEMVAMADEVGPRARNRRHPHQSRLEVLHTALALREGVVALERGEADVDLRGKLR